MLKLYESYLDNRVQRVVINGYTCDQRSNLSGVAQGSVSRPLLFVGCINDVVEGINRNIRLFADDSSLYLTIDCPHETAVCLNNDPLYLTLVYCLIR